MSLNALNVYEMIRILLFLWSSRKLAVLNQIGYSSLLSTWDILTIHFDKKITGLQSTLCSGTVVSHLADECWAITNNSETKWIIRSSRNGKLKSARIRLSFVRRRSSLPGILLNLQYLDWFWSPGFRPVARLAYDVTHRYLQATDKTNRWPSKAKKGLSKSEIFLFFIPSVF